MRAAIDAERRADTRSKIQLGGLIVKAGLAEFDKGALYAGLLDLRERLGDPDENNRLKARGREALNAP